MAKIVLILSLLFYLAAHVESSWSDWGTWSHCSASCGDGFQIQTRDCTILPGDAACWGPPKQSRLCHVEFANCIKDPPAIWSPFAPVSEREPGGYTPHGPVVYKWILMYSPAYPGNTPGMAAPYNYVYMPLFVPPPKILNSSPPTITYRQPPPPPNYQSPPPPTYLQSPQPPTYLQSPPSNYLQSPPPVYLQPPVLNYLQPQLQPQPVWHQSMWQPSPQVRQDRSGGGDVQMANDTLTASAAQQFFTPVNSNTAGTNSTTP